MEQQQSFRSDLVEWLKEIVPFSKIETYTRKTREGMDTNPMADRHANHVTYIICTDKHRYSISASPTYLGCIASTNFYRPGENWTRGNDLPDGKFCRETWEKIKDAIIRYELVKLVPEYSAQGVPDLPKANYEPTPEELECQAARAALWEAKDRYERAERVLLKQHINKGVEEASPLDMPKVAEYHAEVIA